MRELSPPHVIVSVRPRAATRAARRLKHKRAYLADIMSASFEIFILVLRLTLAVKERGDEQQDRESGRKEEEEEIRDCTANLRDEGFALPYQCIDLMTCPSELRVSTPSISFFCSRIAGVVQCGAASCKEPHATFPSCRCYHMKANSRALRGATTGTEYSIEVFVHHFQCRVPCCATV